MKYRVSISASLVLALASCVGSTSGNLPTNDAALARTSHATDPAIVVGYYQDPDGGRQTGLLTFASSGSAPLQTLASADPYELLAANSGGYFVRRDNSGGVQIIAEYSASGSMTRVLGGLTGPGAMATDVSGNLYVIDSGTAVVEFSPSATTPTRTAATGINIKAIALDAGGHLYVASSSTVKVPGSIAEYAPGSSKPFRKVGLDHSQLLGMAVDPQRSLLYVLKGGAVTQTISVYRAGTPAPTRVVPAKSVYSIVIGATGKVYVLGSPDDVGRLEVYSPGAVKHLQSFYATRSYPPFACGANPGLAVDRLGDAYVADCSGTDYLHPSGDTLEFSSAGRLMRTLQVGQDVPSGVIVLN
jgi:hypothetical protein